MNRYHSATLKQLFFVVTLFAVFTTPGFAQHENAGSSGFDFLNLNYDARAVALSGAIAALPNDLYGLFTNPAAIAYLGTSQVVVGYRPIGAGIFGVPVAYAKPKEGKGVFAFGVSGLSTGSFSATGIGPDGSMVSIGTGRADYIAANVAWARKLNNFCGVALSAKGIYNYLGTSEDHYSADGFAFDGGVQCRFMNSRLIYGLVIRNIGYQWSGYTENDRAPLPAGIDLGVSFIPRNFETLRLAFDIDKRRGDYLTFRPGAEWELIKNQLVARLGYSFSYSDFLYVTDILAGKENPDYIKSNRTTFCLGAGFITKLFERTTRFDAAVEFADSQPLPVLVASILTDL
jgi:hypothetical protein